MEAFRQNDYARALVLLEPLAERGNIRAEALVGQMYFNGRGVAENLAVGLQWTRKAAEQGATDAQALLGAAYRQGRGVKQDYREALNWFTKAADQGDSSAQYSIGEMYEHGEGVPRDKVEAKKWYEKAHPQLELPKEVIEALDASTSITLYSLQPWGGPDIPEWDFHGHHQLGHVDLLPKQAQVAISALKDAVAAGESNAMTMCLFNPRHALRVKTKDAIYDILICYQCGQLELHKNDLPLPFVGIIRGKADALNGLLTAAGIPLADVPAALNAGYAEEAKVALKKAEEGDAKAQDVIARLLMRGRGVKKDEAEGIKWLARSMATTLDKPDFQLKLGDIYWRGQYIAQDYREAMTLFEKAAAQGNSEAVYRIGKLYHFGDGVAKDETEAMKRFHQAAEAGNAEAQFEIGVRYAQGRDLKQDYSEAMKWLRKAAEQSHPDALSWIGALYEKGWGVAKDLAEAYFWNRLAKKYGTSNGGDISVTLTREQLAVIDKRMADWIATHPRRARVW